jgi:hypothetical protein
MIFCEIFSVKATLPLFTVILSRVLLGETQTLPVSKTQTLPVSKTQTLPVKHRHFL